MRLALLPGLALRLAGYCLVATLVVGGCTVAGLAVARGSFSVSSWSMALAISAPATVLLATLVWSMTNRFRPPGLVVLIPVVVSTALVAASGLIGGSAVATLQPSGLVAYVQAGQVQPTTAPADQAQLATATVVTDTRLAGVVWVLPAGSDRRLLPVGELDAADPAVDVAVAAPIGWNRLAPGPVIKAILADALFLSGRVARFDRSDRSLLQRFTDEWQLLLEVAGLAFVAATLGLLVSLPRWPVLGAALAVAAWRAVLVGYRSLAGPLQDEIAELIRRMSLEVLVPALAVVLTGGLVFLLGRLRPVSRQPDA